MNRWLRLAMFLPMVPVTIVFILGSLSLHGWHRALSAALALLSVPLLTLDLRRIIRNFRAG